MKPTLNCRQASRLISRAQDAELLPGDRARLTLHFVLCKTCRTVDEQMKFLSHAIRQMQVPERSD